MKKFTNLMLFLYAYGILTFVWLVYKGNISLEQVWSYINSLAR